MKTISKQFIEAMGKSLQKHRQKFTEVLKNKPNIYVRNFFGPKIFHNYLLKNIRIAHLSDQHVGRVTPMKTQKEAIKLALLQNPDMVFLTGDFVCHSELYLEDL